MNDALEKRPPCLYMLWRHLKRDVETRPVDAGYSVHVYREGDDQRLIELNRIDGESMTVKQWRDYLDCLLPDGLFLAELGLGFQPFLHTTEVAERWQRVCISLHMPYTQDEWPTHLPSLSGPQWKCRSSETFGDGEASASGGNLRV